MTELRSIEIDFEIHKLIETERRNFAEQPYEILGRLLKFSNWPENDALFSYTAPKHSSWISGGVILPHGTKLRGSYNKQSCNGEIIDGKWVVDGLAYRSPSGALAKSVKTKEGKETNLNGWGYWEVLLPNTQDWIVLKKLRDQIKEKFSTITF